MLIVELLQKAKKLYLENQGKCGMCWCIKVIANEGKTRQEQSNKGHVPYSSIVAQIPEFNPDFLAGDYHELTTRPEGISVGLCFWWNIIRTDVRIDAFDKLIELYKDSDKEFIW